jgi:catechol 2,3-dioxygenase-like lactoylglutathione lyase family enzyme
MWTHITAQLNVPDLEQALEWYRVHLGCRIAWRSGDRSYGAVYNGTTELFFHQAAPAAGGVGESTTAGTVLCIRVPDVEAVWAGALEAGIQVVSELSEKPWQMREFEIRDPWGHRLRIGQSTLHPAASLTDTPSGS